MKYQVGQKFQIHDDPYWMGTIKFLKDDGTFYISVNSYVDAEGTCHFPGYFMDDVTTEFLDAHVVLL